MRRSGPSALGACIVAVVLAGAAPTGPFDPLANELAQAQAHTAPLSEHAATTPDAQLGRPADDEYEAFAAVTAAEDALDAIDREALAALSGADTIALHTAIGSAHASLRAYTRARMLGDRQAMEQAAGDALSSLRRASAIVSATQKLRATR